MNSTKNKFKQPSVNNKDLYNFSNNPGNLNNSTNIVTTGSKENSDKKITFAN